MPVEGAEQRHTSAGRDLRAVHPTATLPSYHHKSTGSHPLRRCAAPHNLTYLSCYLYTASARRLDLNIPNRRARVIGHGTKTTTGREGIVTI